MTSLARRRRLATPLALALAVGVVGGVAWPASAATTAFDQTEDLRVGNADLSVSTGIDVAIPATGTSGAAAAYPSTIVVPAPAVAPIVDVDVDIQGVAHQNPLDLDIMLVGPGGQQVLLMSDAADATNVTNQDLTFDDEAAAGVPPGTLVSGDYQPTNSGVETDAFDAPAPSSSGNTLLSVFDGTSPAGTWSLYVMDDQSSGVGAILSWELHIETATQPYPSTLSVSGLPPISDLNVRLQGISSTFPDDVDLLLVGPGGQQATVMSDSGAGADIANVDLLLDDEATSPLPDETGLTSGTFKPTNYEGVDGFPAPAPVSDGSAALSVFDGVSPNGQWSLFAEDDTNADATLVSGWSLQFTWADTLSPTGTVSVNGGAATASSPAVTLNVTATDPAPASGVAQMRFSNDGVTFSAFQPYAATAPWTLTAGDGAKTVYAQFQDADGNVSAVVSDTITLTLPDTTAPRATKLVPKRNAKDVKVTTKVKVKASEALMSSSVNGKTVFLEAKGSSRKVKAKVSYNAVTKMIVLTPKRDLKTDTKYQVTVKNGVKDVAGNGWDEKPAKAGAQALRFAFFTA